LDQIAHVAGVAKPLIHYHFGSKADLWVAAVSEELDEFMSEVMKFEENLTETDQTDFARIFAERMVRFAATHRSLIQIALDETRQGGERAEWILNHYFMPISQVVNGVFAQILPKDGGKHYASHMLPSLFGAIVFPFLDADVVASTHGRDVFSEDYIAGQAEFIAMLLRVSVEDSKRDLNS